MAHPKDKNPDCEHSLIDENNEGIYGTEVCRICGQRFKDGEPIDDEPKDEDD
jgi:hypothetical protein